MSMSPEDLEAFHAFNLYDKDGDGYISQEELKRFLMTSLHASGVVDVNTAAHQAMINAFRTCDRNLDGQLSFDEFKRWYRSHMHAASKFRQVSSPTNGKFLVTVPSATYCHYDGFDVDVSAKGKPVRRKRARALGGLDPSVKEYYKDVFVAYEIHLVTPEREWSVFKRYSSLHSLVKQLKKKISVDAKASFPPKVIGKVNIEDRRVGLEWFMRALLRDRLVREQPMVLEFLESTDAEPPSTAEGDQLQLTPGKPVDVFEDTSRDGALTDLSSFGDDSDILPRETALMPSHHSRSTAFGQSVSGMPLRLDPVNEELAPELRLERLQIQLPPPLPNGFYRDGPIVTVAVKLSDVKDAMNHSRRTSGMLSLGSGSHDFGQQFQQQWDVERQCGLHVLALLESASMRDLSIVTVISIHTERHNEPSGRPDSALVRATQSLLREVLGKRGHGVLHSHTARELASFFKEADVNGDGRLSPDEMMIALRKLSLPATKEFVQMMLDVADSDGDGTIDYNEFIEFVSTARSEDQEMKNAFRQFDLDGDGRITVEELQSSLQKQGQRITHDEAAAIVSQCSGQRGFLTFRDFKRMMSDGRTSSGGGAVLTEGDEMVVVTAHVPLDEEVLDSELFEAQLLARGVRLKKHNRRGKVAARTFFIDPREPTVLRWRKGGLKTGSQGTFDLRMLVDLVVGEQQQQQQQQQQAFSSPSPVVQNANLIIQLKSTVGPALRLEARNAHEQRVIVDGIRHYREKLREQGMVTSTLSSQSSLAVTGRAERERQRERLIRALGQHDNDGDGFISPISLGHVLSEQGMELSHIDMELIMSRVTIRADGLVDYRAFAWEVTGLRDPETAAKVQNQTTIVAELQKLDANGDGFISAVALGQGLAKAAIPDLPANMISFAATESDPDGTGVRIDYRQFSRIVTGLDESSNERMAKDLLAKTSQLTDQINDEYNHFIAEMVDGVLSQYDSAMSGTITPVNLGQALSQFGFLSQDDVSSLLSKADTRRDGSLYYRGKLSDGLVDIIVQTQEKKWMNAFMKWDRNNDGNLTIRELESALNSILRKIMPRAEVESILRASDLDLNGSLSQQEFMLVLKLIDMQK